MENKGGSRLLILLSDYAREIQPTDRLPHDDIQPVLLGLFGEVGSVMAIAKKRHREDAAYWGYREALEEEFGDVLWYFTALCRRLGVGVDRVFAKTMLQGVYEDAFFGDDFADIPIPTIILKPMNLMS